MIMRDPSHDPRGEHATVPAPAFPERPEPGTEPPSPHTRRRLLAVLLLGVLAALVGALVLGVARHRREATERARLAHAADQGPRVLVAPASLPVGRRTVSLPGDVRAFFQATVYAKVSGYVTALLVDKGDRVREGQVLARISSPETDDQVRAAAATLALRRRNAARAHRLIPTGVISQAELDQADGDLRTAEADFRRAKALQAYEVVRAPFDGVVTTRYVDPGALLTASSTGAPLVDVADPSRVRIFVNVGQDAAPFVRIGDPGEITLDQHPSVRALARVARTSDALDPRSRSMLVELWLVGDPGVRLVPGLFVHVDLQVAIPPLPTVPSDALVARGERLQVAVVRDHVLHFVDVEPGQTDGHTVQIRSGLSGGELVALSPPSDLGDGAHVQPMVPPPPRGETSRVQGARSGRAPPAQ